MSNYTGRVFMSTKKLGAHLATKACDNDHGYIIFSSSVESLLSQALTGLIGIAPCKGKYRCDGCVIQHFRESITAEYDDVLRSDRRRGQLWFHVNAHPQAFGQDVTLRMCECRKRVDQASLHKFLDQGMIAGQLLEFGRPVEVGATIAQVCDVGNLR